MDFSQTPDSCYKCGHELAIHACYVHCADETMTFEQSQSAVCDELQKVTTERDMSRLKRLFRSSHRDRRHAISQTTEGVPKILEMFPLMKDITFVS